MAASRRKSFHISVMSHNAKVKLCNLYQFAEAFSDIASCKIFCPCFIFHHFTINCVWLMLFLHERKQVLVVVKQFSFNRNVSLKQILLTWFNIFPSSCLQTEESSKARLVQHLQWSQKSALQCQSH